MKQTSCRAANGNSKVGSQIGELEEQVAASKQREQQPRCRSSARFGHYIYCAAWGKTVSRGTNQREVKWK